MPDPFISLLGPFGASLDKVSLTPFRINPAAAYLDADAFLQNEPATRLLIWADVKHLEIGNHRPQLEQKEIDNPETIRVNLDKRTLAEARAAGERCPTKKRLNMR